MTRLPLPAPYRPLRPPRLWDYLALMRLHNDPEVRRYLGGPRPYPLAELQAAKAVPAPSGLWVTRGAGGGGILLVSLTPYREAGTFEMSFQMSPKLWGQGLATRACRAVLIHAETLGLTEVYAETQAGNRRSLRLLDRLGFHEIARLERFGAKQVVLFKPLERATVL